MPRVQRLHGFEDRVAFCQAGIVGWDPPACEVVLSSYVVHHVPPDGLSVLLARIARALQPEGCLLRLDQMSVGPEWGERMRAQPRRLYRQRVALAIAEGRATEEGIDARWAFKGRMKDEGRDVEYCHSAERLLELMQEAGFQEYGLVWHVYPAAIIEGFAGWLIREPCWAQRCSLPSVPPPVERT